MVHGHFNMDEVADCDPIRGWPLLTVLREPVSRVVSLYDYWRSRTQSFIDTSGESGLRVAKSSSLLQFVKSTDPMVVKEVCNGMCRTVAGHRLHQSYLLGRITSDDLADAAINNLQRFQFVGTISHLAAAVDWIANEMQLAERVGHPLWLGPLMSM